VSGCLVVIIIVYYATQAAHRYIACTRHKTIKHKKDKLLILKEKNIKRKTRIKYKCSLQSTKSYRKSNGKIFEYRMFYRTGTDHII